jgi:hypothetical protein
VIYTPRSDQIRQIEPRIEDSGDFRIDNNVQPVLLVVDADRFLIDSPAIQTVATCWLGIGVYTKL